MQFNLNPTQKLKKRLFRNKFKRFCYRIHIYALSESEK